MKEDDEAPEPTVQDEEFWDQLEEWKRGVPFFGEDFLYEGEDFLYGESA